MAESPSLKHRVVDDFMAMNEEYEKEKEETRKREEEAAIRYVEWRSKEAAIRYAEGWKKFKTSLELRYSCKKMTEICI